MYRVVVGVGNPLLGDDAVGIEVVKELARRKGEINAEIKYAMAGGLELAEMIYGYDFAIIVDAVRNMKGVGEMMLEDYRESVANHDIDFPRAYRMLSRYVKMPPVRIVGIGIKNVSIGEGLSEEVKEMVPLALKKIEEIMEEENGTSG